MHRLPHLILFLVAIGMSASPGAAQDTPGNARFVFQLVEADGFTDSDPEIADVVNELRDLFRFEGYRLLDTGLLNSATLAANAQTRLAGGDHGSFQVAIHVTQHGETSELLRVAVELQSEQEGTTMEAAVNVRDGQTLVLGSTRTSSGAALILIMRTTIQ